MWMSVVCVCVCIAYSTISRVMYEVQCKKLFCTGKSPCGGAGCRLGGCLGEGLYLKTVHCAVEHLKIVQIEIEIDDRSLRQY